MRTNRLARDLKEAPASFLSLGVLATELAQALQPQERLAPSQAAEKYRILHNPGAYSGPYLNETTPYMAEPLDVLADREKKACIFVGPAQTGKALPLGTPIATPQGWSTMGDLQVGDIVFGSDGSPVVVLGVSPVMHDHPCYTVRFDDGVEIVADAEHLWQVTDQSDGKVCIRTTEQIAVSAGRGWAIPRPGPLQLPRRDLPEPPYALGLTLGDRPIPEIYLRASIDQRQELLRGLLDASGGAAFPKTLPDRQELVASLGKLLAPDFRRIISVDPAPSVPVRCIRVSAEDHLFLAGRAMVPTHNTDSLILNSILYTVVCDPMDTILYQTSQSVAADFSRTRLDRMHRHSPDVGRRVLPGGSADTVHAKYYDSGIVVNLSWPTINEMSGKPRGLVLLTDYDRMPQDIDGEGSPFDLGMKRTTTFRSKAKTLCESSPGFEVEAGTTWVPRTRHEAPPCKGILALYNRGDRRRWYWKCPHCSEWFEPVFETLRYPTGVSPGEAAAQVWMACPTNGCVISPDLKYDLNKRGRWVKDGQRLTADDELVGEPVQSSYASFWMFGPAAAFTSWGGLVEKYLMAELEYERTGSQEALKATVNTDQGMPYRRRGQQRERNPEELKNRSDSWPRGSVPPDVRFLLATVDVQGKKWVCQVFGVAPGSPYDLVVIDRFDIAKSKRLDDDGHPLPTEPHAYPEDWHLLKSTLLEREYPIAGTDALMQIKGVACDSGGKEGVTARAYQFWYDLRAEGDGLHRRFQLVKGDPAPGAPRARIAYMDAQVKGQTAQVRGEVPVLMLASNTLKDDLNGRLDRLTPGGGMVRFPEWLPDAFFTEMCVEMRSEKGWEAPRGHRQEAWDLAYYAIGYCVHLGVEKIDWAQPPAWALPWDAGNALVRKQEQAPRFKPSKSLTGGQDFAKLLAS